MSRENNQNNSPESFFDINERYNLLQNQFNNEVSNDLLQGVSSIGPKNSTQLDNSESIKGSTENTEEKKNIKQEEKCEENNNKLKDYIGSNLLGEKNENNIQKMTGIELNKNQKNEKEENFLKIKTSLKIYTKTNNNIQFNNNFNINNNSNNNNININFNIININNNNINNNFNIININNNENNFQAENEVNNVHDMSISSDGNENQNNPNNINPNGNLQGNPLQNFNNNQINHTKDYQDKNETKETSKKTENNIDETLDYQYQYDIINGNNGIFLFDNEYLNYIAENKEDNENTLNNNGDIFNDNEFDPSNISRNYGFDNNNN